MHGQEVTPINRKVIQYESEKIICYVTDDHKSPKSNRLYYWYLSREVHQSIGGYYGHLLDGSFTRLTTDNTLLEKGAFKKGLKNGRWSSWYHSGVLKHNNVWKKGIRSGQYTAYDSLGKPEMIGRYKNGLKTGKWVYPKLGDTILFKKGIEVVFDNNRAGFPKRLWQSFGRLFKSSKKNEGSEKNIESGKKALSPNEKIKTSEEVEKTKPTFFRRLFKKKQKAGGNTPVKPKDSLIQKERKFLGIFKMKNKNQ